MTVFVCKQCHTEKPLEDFYLSSDRARPARHLCRSCFSDRYYRPRYQLTEKSQRRDETSGCRHCGGRVERPQRRVKLYCSVACKKADRRYRVHDMTKVEHDAMIAAQDGCAICHCHDPGPLGWVIDHDHGCCPLNHGCGKCVRGILCGRCNVGIGQFADTPDRLRAAASYLETSAT